MARISYRYHHFPAPIRQEMSDQDYMDFMRSHVLPKP
jgi:hypothetical protein